MTGRRARKRRRVAVITGTRAEYGLLCSTMDAIERHAKLDLQLVVTGMHLVKKFGHTIDDIIRDGRRIDARVPMQKGDDSPLDQAAGLGRGVAGIAEFLQQSATEIVVVLGDRIEAMAGALAAVTTGRILAHFHGGDVATGDFDDSLRHAMTKLAHVHLAATKSACRRIIRMGEQPERVHWVGAPGLDRLRELIELDRDSYLGPTPAGIPSRENPPPARRANIGRTGKQAPAHATPALVLHHAIGRPPQTERRVMRTILNEVARAGLKRTIIFPNSDRGHTGIIEAIEDHRNNYDPAEVEVIASLDRDAFLKRLIEARVLIGNSSSGIIEAATAGTPAVNVGSRQEGRERSSRAVVDAAETALSIREALKEALRRRPIKVGSSVYGDGRAGRRIVEILARIQIDDAFRRKRLAY